PRLVDRDRDDNSGRSEAFRCGSGEVCEGDPSRRAKGGAAIPGSEQPQRRHAEAERGGRKVRRTLAVVMLFLGIAAAPALADHVADYTVHLPVPEVERLPNGLQVVWFLNPALPVVDLSLLLQSGDRDDPPGKSGTAGLLEALIDRGNAGWSAQQLAH